MSPQTLMAFIHVNDKVNVKGSDGRYSRASVTIKPFKSYRHGFVCQVAHAESGELEFVTLDRIEKVKA